MSMKLRELVRLVRSCKTAAEERAVITKESAMIRTAFKEENLDYRHRNIAKLLYISMLGYPTHFGQMECIKLISGGNARFNEKRIGYLAMTLLLDERQEVLTLVTNSLQSDLHSNNMYVVGLALTALGTIGSAEMTRDLANDVDVLLKSANPYIRKKAALCCIRLLRKVPDLVDTFLPHIVVLLTDRNHNVLLTGVTLVTAVVELAPSYAEKFTRLVPALVKILRKLLMAGYAPEYDIGGVTDPVLQAKILFLLRVLGRGNALASETMNAALAQVATNTEALKNAGNAVLYECVHTIMAVESESGLRVLAVNILGKFLGSKDPNLKYVALETLAGVVHLDVSAVQRHRTVIVECLHDADVSIRRRALELVYVLVNEENARAMIKEMLEYLPTADADSKPDVCAKIASAADRFSVGARWHIDTLVALLAIAGNVAKREIASMVLFLISHAQEEHASLTHKLYAMAASAVASGAETQQPLLQVAVWCVGEYGQLLTASPPRGHAEFATGPLGEARAPSDIIRLLERLLHLYYANAETKAMVLTALLKLTSRLTDAAQLARVRAILASFEGSGEVELQQRAVEYTAIVAPGRVATLEGHRAELLAPMPLLDESVLRERAGAATGAATDAAALAGDDVAMAVLERTQPKQHDDPSPAKPPTTTAAAAGGQSSLLDLDSLFSVVTTSAGSDILSDTHTAVPAHRLSASPPAIAAAPGSGFGALDDLFGSPPGAAAHHTPAAAHVAPAAFGRPAAAAPQAPAASSGMGAIDDLFASSSISASSAPMPGTSTAPHGHQQQHAHHEMFGAGHGHSGHVGMGGGASGNGSGVQGGSSSGGAGGLMGDLFAPHGAGSGHLQQMPVPHGAFPSPGAGPSQQPPAPASAFDSTGGIGGSGIDDFMGGGFGGVAAGRVAAKPAAPAPAAAAAAADPFAAAVTSPYSSAPAAAVAASGDGFSAFESAAPAPAALALPHTLLGYDSGAPNGLRVVIRCEKPSGGLGSPVTELTLSFTAERQLSGFVCQAAVPKYMKLTILPASGTTVGPGGAAPVTQVIRVDNSQQGTKPVMLKLKLVYTPPGASEAVSETTDVKNFPVAL